MIVQPHPHFAAPALAAIALFGSGCGIGDFDVQRAIGEQRVSGSPLSALLDTFFDAPIPMDVDIEQETAARDGGPAQAAHLTRLDFNITPTAMVSPDRDDFSFLQTVSVYIESTRSDSALPRQKIAEALDIGEVSTLRFRTLRDVDVLPYTEEGARFVSEARGNAPPDDVTFAGSFAVTIELF
jgi:hypothetical protein